MSIRYVETPPSSTVLLLGNEACGAHSHEACHEAAIAMERFLCDQGRIALRSVVTGVTAMVHHSAPLPVAALHRCAKKLGARKGEARERIVQRLHASLTRSIDATYCVTYTDAPDRCITDGDDDTLVAQNGGAYIAVMLRHRGVSVFGDDGAQTTLEMVEMRQNPALIAVETHEAREALAAFLSSPVRISKL